MMNEITDKTTDYPRVLIVNSQSILAKNATGITLRSLWRSWPSERVMELYCDSNYEKVYEFDLVSFQMGLRNIPLRTIMISSAGHSINKSLKENSAGNTSNSVSWKGRIRKVAVCISDVSVVHIDSKLLNIIRRFDPQIIYTLGGNVLSLKTSYILSKKLGKPIVLHYMDNWIENFQWEDDRLLRFYRRALDKWHRKCLENSNIGITISQLMADEYTRRFHIPHVPLMNSVAIDSFVCDENKRNDPPIFVYAGGLHLNRWRNLHEIAQVIGDRGRFIIYTGNQDRGLYETEFADLNVEFRDYVPHDRIHEVYEKADILVHTEVENPTGNRFFKYSISTKIPEYLATGKNILFYGPKDIGLYQYLQTNNVAFCAGNISELSDAVNIILENGCDEEMRSRALALVQRNHEVSNSQMLLRKTLAEGK